MAYFLNPITFYEAMTADYGEIMPSLQVKYEHQFRMPFEYLPWSSLRLTVFVRDCFPLAVFGTILYLLSVFAVRAHMAKREGFKLRRSLIAWSVGLAIFSWAGFIRTLEEYLYVLFNHGLYKSVCYHFYFHGSVSEFWSALYVLSKLFEFGDTFFIVLRKKQLIFLHYYHHAFVFIASVHAGAVRNAAGRWYVVFNYMAHSFMYTYYAATALGYNVPKPLRMSVTIVQISQLFIGCICVLLVYYYKYFDLPCQQTDGSLFMSAIMYGSFFVLFLKFFAEAYLLPKKNKKTATAVVVAKKDD